MRTATNETTRTTSETRDLSRKDPAVVVRSSAELAECTCPDWCERDHDRD